MIKLNVAILYSIFMAVIVTLPIILVLGPGYVVLTFVFTIVIYTFLPEDKEYAEVLK